MAVERHKGVEVNERTDLLRNFFRHARNYHSAIGMAAEHEVRKFLAADHAKDVLHVRVEVDRAVHQMRALTEAGQSRRIDLMPGLSKPLRNLPVAPAAVPGSMHQNKRRHRDPPWRASPQPSCGSSAARVTSRRSLL